MAKTIVVLAVLVLLAGCGLTPAQKNLLEVELKYLKEYRSEADPLIQKHHPNDERKLELLGISAKLERNLEAVLND